MEDQEAVVVSADSQGREDDRDRAKASPEPKGVNEVIESLMRFQGELARKIDSGLAQLGQRVGALEVQQAPPLNLQDLSNGPTISLSRPIGGRFAASVSPGGPSPLIERIQVLETELSILEQEYYRHRENVGKRVAALERECLDLDSYGENT